MASALAGRVSLRLGAGRLFRRAHLGRTCAKRLATSPSRGLHTSHRLSDHRAALFRLETHPASREEEGLRTTSGEKAFSSPLEFHDAGEKEAWALVSPATEEAGAVRSALTRLLLGNNHSGRPYGIRAAHPFLHDTGLPPSRAVQLCSFATRVGGGAQGFVDYSARYGAIREEDRVTLYESLMEELGVAVGNVARARLVPDPLAPSKDATGNFKWSSATERQEAIAQAQKADAQVRSAGQLLFLGPELLDRPLIALSNGQTRRARILVALLRGGQIVVLEEPFTGLDAPTRHHVEEVLKGLHSRRDPRIVLVLRPQDTIPEFITHVVRVSEDGAIAHAGLRAEERAEASFLGRVSGPGGERGGYETVKARAAAKRTGAETSHDEQAETPVARLHDVTISYPTKQVLVGVSFALAPGSHTILVGDNGSGKTTLLALLLGDHPQSYALPGETLSLFGHARAETCNATVHLRRRVGHFSPELFNAFPRRPVGQGGLTVEQAIGSGWSGIFSPRPLTEHQRSRIHDMLALFQDVLAGKSGPTGGGKKPQGENESVEHLAETAFAALTPGSQACILFLRAVVHRPELLVLDEPFQGMDARQVARVRAYLQAMRLGPGRDDFTVGRTEEERTEDAIRRQRTALVLVSHYESEWITSADGLIRLRDGKVTELL